MIKWLVVLFIACSSSCLAQSLPAGGMIYPRGGGFTPIAVDAACTNASTSNFTNFPCSPNMTIPAGDTIYMACFVNGNSFDQGQLNAHDGFNGYYGQIIGNSHPAGSTYWMSIFYKENAVGGTYAPICSNYENNGFGMAALAISGARSSFALDGAAVINLFNLVAVAATNPTAGTAGAPTNSNEAIICDLILTSSTTVTGGSGYSPGGTLTGAINGGANYLQYVINPSTANCPFGTTVTKTYTDAQIALINASSPQGYKALGPGFYGAPAAAQTNGGTASLAIMNTNAGSLTGLNADTPGAWWSLLSGSVVTWDTSVHPLGTFPLIVDGVSHVLGDAATSIKFPAANINTGYVFGPKSLIANGTGEWLGSWYRQGTGAVTNQFCDNYNLGNTLTAGNFTTQILFNTSPGINFQFELEQGDIVGAHNMNPSPLLNINQDYYLITHVAGIDEPNDELYVMYEATPGTLPWIVHDHFTSPKQGPIQAQTTATAASGGLSTIIVASATGIFKGQAVQSALGSSGTTQLTFGTYVTSVTGTSIGISLPTNASMAGTNVQFLGPAFTTTASVTAGSTTLTVASGTGIVAGTLNIADFIGMTGVPAGTWVVSGSGTSWVMSEPATSTQASVDVQFWEPNGSGGAEEVHFGKYSSCTTSADMWYSGMIFDPYGTTLPLIANGTLPL